MHLSRGSVVRSTAGRDEGKYLVIFEVLNEYALVCDGKERPLERPKKKSCKHIKLTNTMLDEVSMKSNKALRHSLWKFNFGSENEESY